MSVDDDNRYSNPSEGKYNPSEGIVVDALKIAAEAHKDHENARQAFLLEMLQNAFDAFYYRWHLGDIDWELDVNFRVYPEENKVEMWDNAGGMVKEELRDNYLSLGVPGEYKYSGKDGHSDTGGSQGKGFWATVSWGDHAFVQTYTEEEGRWGVEAYPTLDAEKPRSPILRSGVEEGPLEQPGTYVRVGGLSDDAMKLFEDTDAVLNTISTTFAFGLAHEAVGDINYEVVGDGTYSPDVYDIKEMVEQGAIIEGEDLDVIDADGQDRQLTDLYLIDQRELDGSIPPWEGIALLKGGAYTDSFPYLSVWEYALNNNDVVKSGEVWGWVNASDFTPEYEDHGHVGFRKTHIVYHKSGLKSRVGQVISDEFHNHDTKSQDKASEETLDLVNKYLNVYDDIGEIGGGGGGGGTDGDDTERVWGEPNDPRLGVHCGKYGREVGEEVGLKIEVITQSGKDEWPVHIQGTLTKKRDADGSIIPKDEREPLLDVDAQMHVEGGQTDGTTVFLEKIVGNEKGVYVFTVELKEYKPELDEEVREELDVDDNRTYDISSATINIGGVTWESETIDEDPPAKLIETRYDTDGADKDWRVRLTPEGDVGQRGIIVNLGHPEFIARLDNHGEKNRTKVAIDYGAKAAFQRVFMKRAAEDIKDMLEEYGMDTSAVSEKVESIIDERLNDHDKFRKDMVPDSPIYGGE